jgi:hypothetical protein
VNRHSIVEADGKMDGRQRVSSGADLEEGQRWWTRGYGLGIQFELRRIYGKLLCHPILTCDDACGGITRHWVLSVWVMSRDVSKITKFREIRSIGAHFLQRRVRFKCDVF